MMREENKTDGEVVYRRIEAGGEGEDRPTAPTSGGRNTPPATSNLAPALKTAIVGFTLLLALIMLLGYLSVRKADEVSSKILDDERRYAAVRDFALELRISSTRLDNEARARARKLVGETEETRPLTEMRLGGARDEVKKQIQRLAGPAFNGDEEWRGLNAHLAAFVQATEDPDAYLRDGYVKFRDVEKDLDALLEKTHRQQEDIHYSNEQLRRSGARRIYLLTAIALFMGALVAAYTIREMQRRYRELRASLEEVRREREFSTQMLEGMVSAVAAVDSQGRIRSANRAFFHIFPSASIGASVYEEISSQDGMKMLEAATSSIVERSTYRGRWVCGESMPGCEDRSFDIYSSPLTIDGEQGKIVTMVDVTEAAEAESNLRRSESLAAMGQAVAQVAHEIKNPLGSIRLGVSMLRDTSTDEESLGTIDLVERGINHLNKLVVDVTQFSRRRPLEVSEVELGQLLDSSLELAADVIQEKHTPVEKRYSAEPMRGLWDADQLRQVFVNLVANAVDASQEGQPLVISTVRASAAEGEGAGEGNGHAVPGRARTVARITVEDSGVGMDERTRAHLFEPFYTTKKRGTGLGLAIVKQIVEQHGGTISVESAKGQGTRFIVDLPMKK